MSFRAAAGIGLLWLTLSSSWAIGNELESALKAMMPGHAVTEKRVALEEEQRDELRNRVRRKAYIPRAWSLFSLVADSGEVGYAGQWRTMGKHAPISLLVTCDSAFEVVRVRILQQSEKYGRGITQPSFLKPFTGKTLKDEWRIWHDFDGITGATVSSTAVLNAVHDCLQCIVLLARE